MQAMLLENLSTARLTFRSLKQEDKQPLMAFFKDPEATKFLYIDENSSGTLENYVDNWLSRQWSRYDSLGTGLCALEIKETGELIGQCGLIRQFVDGIPKWEVGYHLIREFWGKGYATEAAVFCRDFCFKNEMAETLISLIHPDNHRSKAVAERNGMQYWKHTLFKGNPADVFRIRRDDWEALTG